LNRVTNVSYQGGVVQTFAPDETGNSLSNTMTPAPLDLKAVSATTWAFFATADAERIPDAWVTA